jgi:hypothetical protein
MSGHGPLGLIRQLATILDDIGVPYVLGGSMASSVMGEPRSTVDVDMAVRLDPDSGEALIDRLRAHFYVPVAAARDAIAAHSSFNAVDNASFLKLDLFVLGDGLLDRRQIERRVLVDFGDDERGIWVTSAEDQVLRKLDRYRQSNNVSDRQWRDVVGILRVRMQSLDFEYLRATAEEVGLADLLHDAIAAAGAG